MIPEYMRESVAAHDLSGWQGWEDRFCHIAQERPPSAKPTEAPPERPKVDLRPSYAKTQSKPRTGLQTGKKPAALPVVRAEKPGRVPVEPRDPATCNHFQHGRSLWFKNGWSKSKEQKVICPACKRESRIVDGVTLDPGPYVPMRVANPPADLPGFIAAFAANHSLTGDDVFGASRLAPIVDMRRELCHTLASEPHNMSHRQIGAAINKDNASVTYLLQTRKGPKL